MAATFSVSVHSMDLAIESALSILTQSVIDVMLEYDRGSFCSSPHIVKPHNQLRPTPILLTASQLLVLPIDDLASYDVSLS